MSTATEEARAEHSRAGMPVQYRQAHRVGGALLVLAVTGIQAAYWNATTPSWGESSTLLIALAFCAAGFVSAGLLAADPGERLFWRGLTLNGFLVFVGRAYLAFNPLLPAPSLATYLDLVAALVFMAAIALTTRFREAATGARLRYLLDGAATLLVSYVLMFSVVLPGTYREAGLATGEQISAAFYAAAGAVIVFGTLVHLTGPGKRTSRWEVMLAVGFAVAGFACLLWPFWYVDLMTPSVWSGTSFVEVLWVAGVGLLGLAALHRLTEREEAWRPITLSGGWWPGHTAADTGAWLLLTLSAPAFAVGAILTTGAERSTFLVGLVGLACLAVARVTVVALEVEWRAGWSDTDPLTGLLDPAAMRRRLDEEMGLARRHGEPLSVAVLDIDDFSYVNQAGGYARGDAVLRWLGRALRTATGPHDIAARLDGDAFALIIPGTDAKSAGRACEQLRRKVGELEGVHGGVTISVGIASFPEHAASADEVLRRADEARRIAKCEGKDCTAIYERAAAESLTRDKRVRLLEERCRLETVRLVAAAVDARDPATEGHSRRVADLAAALATRIGLPRRRVRLLEIAALVHDVGKVGVPDAVLCKDGQMTPAEQRTLQQHAELSARIVAATGLVEIVPWILAHHERWDGTGYPDGLAGDDIPLEARILSLCNAFDILTTPRPGHPAKDLAEVYGEVLEGMGDRFDPLLTERLVAVVAERARGAS